MRDLTALLWLGGLTTYDLFDQGYTKLDDDHSHPDGTFNRGLDLD